MEKREIRSFLKNHRFMEISSARIVNSLISEGDLIEDALEERLRPLRKKDDKEMEQVIRDTDDPQKLVDLMRKNMDWMNQCLLREKVLEWEKEALPLLKERAKRAAQDSFIEQALQIFAETEENLCPWIMENYSSFRCEYARSMFSILLGHRGVPEYIPFLIEEAERFERSYPKESYDQGPYIAVWQLMGRFAED